jgi:hypothetical protein
MNRYGKAIAAALLAVVTAIHTMVSDEVITPAEWIQIAIAVVTAISVYLVPIFEYGWMKTAIAVVLASLNVLVTLIADGVTSGDLVQVLLSALTVLTVAFAPARSDPPPNPTPVSRPTL